MTKNPVILNFGKPPIPASCNQTDDLSPSKKDSILASVEYFGLALYLLGNVAVILVYVNFFWKSRYTSLARVKRSAFLFVLTNLFSIVQYLFVCVWFK